MLGRNMGVFLAQTINTLKTASKEDIGHNYDDQRINTKLNFVDYDIVMSHQLPFSKFKEYINEYIPAYGVYVNLYCLNELYKNKLLKLLQKGRKYKQNAISNSIAFEPNDIQDAEYKEMIMNAGRAMWNLLEYIKNNYKTHFNGITVNSIYNLKISINDPRHTMKSNDYQNAS